jgi:phosphoglycolate phosphatase-like HAD superfamily hydrolase
MATKRQLKANRSNARRSSGPRTPAGKARSSLNTLKHGLCARSILIGAEKPEQFEELRAAVITHYKARSALAHDAADRYAATLWRLRRIPAIEAALAEAVRQEAHWEECRALKRTHYSKIYEQAHHACDALYDSGSQILNARLTGNHQRRTTGVFNELSIEHPFQAPTLETISAAKTLLLLIEAPNSLDVLGRLSRYEAALMNVASRQRKELEALQQYDSDLKLIDI